MADPLSTDPPAGLEPPATMVKVTFDSGGTTLLGVLYLPPGPGPHPVVILLHGFPGLERNFDLAQALRRARYAVLVFHYRGAWGMGGSYSWGHALEDAARAVSTVRDPAFAAGHRLDPARVVAAGHSLGGFAALHTGAADPSIAAVVSVTCCDFAALAAPCRDDPQRRAELVQWFEEELLPLRGTSGEALMAELERAGDRWLLPGLAPRLADRPVLLVAASRDAVTPPAIHHQPLLDAYLAQPVDRLEHQLFWTDHALSDHRVTLARTVIDFLDRHVA